MKCIYTISVPGCSMSFTIQCLLIKATIQFTKVKLPSGIFENSDSNYRAMSEHSMPCQHFDTRAIICSSDRDFWVMIWRVSHQSDPFFSDSEVLDSFMYLSMRCKGTPRFISSKNVKPPGRGKDEDSQRDDT